MSVDRDEVDRIARLARLQLESEEADRLTEEMNRILEHAERLRGAGAEGGGHAPAVDTPGSAGRDIEGVRSETGEPDALSDPPGEFAPEWAEGFFVVPPPPGVTAEESE